MSSEKSDSDIEGNDIAKINFEEENIENVLPKLDDELSIHSGGVFSIDEGTSIATEGTTINETIQSLTEQAAIDLSKIRNKSKRAEVFRKFKQKQRKEKIKQRKLRQKQRALDDDAPPVQKPKTIENTRVRDDTMVKPADQEVLFDENFDEFSSYFNREKTPKVLITTSDRPRGRMMKFVRQFAECIPNSVVYYRRALDLKQIIKQCLAKNFTDLIIFNQDRRKPNGLVISHLPDGPTAHFKLSNAVIRGEIKKSDTPTEHKPEIILNNFNTRLGHSIGRMFASLYPHDPEFKGRRVVTFHNQRDFIFFRQHRYIFRDNKRVGLKELGPRCTLKLRSLQLGTFDSKFGEYEWIHKRHEMDTSRKKFHL